MMDAREEAASLNENPLPEKIIKFGCFEVKYEHRSPKRYWGRFGGAWDWELGFQYSSGTPILNILVFSIRIDRIRETKPTPMVDQYLREAI